MLSEVKESKNERMKEGKACLLDKEVEAARVWEEVISGTGHRKEGPWIISLKSSKQVPSE